MRAAGAADFTFLDNHQGGWESWSAQLKLLKPEANWAAKIEMIDTRTVTNNADPMLDGFVHHLARIWEERGGQITHGEDGPLIRFLSAVTTSTLAWVDKKPLTTYKLRGSVRRMRVASRAPK